MSAHSPVLLTSFTTWLPHQLSNASDDLVAEVVAMPAFSAQVYALRHLPVDFVRASQQAIALVQHLQPAGVVLCGMAETRQQLSLEVQAVGAEEIRCTRLDVASLLVGLEYSAVSFDAGRFVCNRLYYDMLHHLGDRPCIFVHVPRLTEANRAAIVSDFCELLRRFLGLTATHSPGRHV